MRCSKAVGDGEEDGCGAERATSHTHHFLYQQSKPGEEEEQRRTVEEVIACRSTTNGSSKPASLKQGALRSFQGCHAMLNAGRWAHTIHEKPGDFK